MIQTNKTLSPAKDRNEEDKDQGVLALFYRKWIN